ncbi:MAG: DUF3047 domain-containing protein [Alphaproteobacteria bacterium]|nr:DUF3047 domain-containing protein [Alphaproteobacteria bacterium]
MKAKAKATAVEQSAYPRIVWLFGALIGAVLAVVAYVSQARASVQSYTVDFTDYQPARGPIDAWLRSKGFRFERDAGSRNKIMLRADRRGLEIDALQQAQGLLINNAINQNQYSAVEIEWGVEKHPQGASYERNVNNEAIMVHVFFGNDKKPSGSMFVPDLPYFIGLFLCNGDRVGYPYTGRYFQAGGRYVCLQSAPAGQTIVSRYDLRSGFQSIFGALVRAVSGYSIEVDTTRSGGAGRSSAFIRRIRFIA